MGLLFSEHGREFDAKGETALLHQLGCRACPLAKEPGRMEPTGAENPLIYMLGEAPGKDEIDEMKQFVGESGQLLRRYVPRQWLPLVRWNNTVRSRPPSNRTPERPEIEACRPSVQADIERSKPKFIFGFGGIPLHWVSGFPGITYWRGRRMPVRVGSHVCWYYAFNHPAWLLRQGRGGSEEERMFRLDLRRAFNEIESMPEPVVHTDAIAKRNIDVLTSVREIENALIWASKLPGVGIDYETNCIRPYEAGAKILTIAVGNEERGAGWALDHRESTFKPQERTDIIDLWRRFLERARCRKRVHNLAFELEWTGFFFGKELIRAGEWDDSASAAAILDERKGKMKPGCFSLEFLTQLYFGFNLKKVSNVDRKRLDSQPLHSVVSYNGMDARYHEWVWQKQWPEIQAQGLQEAYRLALRRVPTVVLSQLKGVPVDQPTVVGLATKYETRIETIERDIQALPIIQEFRRKTGRDFNPLSNAKDVLYVFDNMLQRPEVYIEDKYNKTAKRSADETVLTKIDHPLARAIIDLRQAGGNFSKYIAPLLKGGPNTQLYPDDLIHAQFNTIFAETGRLSCEGPNLQYFPKRDEGARELRRPIAAPPGHLILAVDYGQIEARVIAMFTRDKLFCKALWERYDIHADWAQRLATDYPDRVGGRKNLSDKKVMKDFRTDIKNQWTFPLVFGCKVESAAEYLSIPLNIVKPHFNQFWKEFSGIADWQEKQVEFYNQYGYVECLTGRRRRGPFSVNQVMNTPVQGTAAEIVMDAMARLSETGDPDLQPEINIHDDLTYVRMPETEIDKIAERVIGMMLDVPFEWAKVVPITVEASVGRNWEQLKDAGTFSSDRW